jgi:hypothetical protein
MQPGVDNHTILGGRFDTANDLLLKCVCGDAVNGGFWVIRGKVVMLRRVYRLGMLLLFNVNLLIYRVPDVRSVDMIQLEVAA